MQRLKLFLWLPVVFLCLASTGFCNDGYDAVVVSQDSTGMTLSFTLETYALKDFREGRQTFSAIDFAGGVKTTKKGFAELPFIHAAITLPPTGNPELEVTASSHVDIPLKHPLLPSKGVLYRNQDPASIAYETAKASIVDAWYPQALTRVSEPYIFRKVRGANVYVHPFRYNAATKTLRVYKNVEVRVRINTAKSVNPLPQAMDKSVLPAMDAAYGSVFLNYWTEAAYAPNIGELGDILVIHTQRDAGAIAPYVQWKQEKGFTVHTVQVSPGTNVRNTIQQQYNSNPNILYVQLVGDWQDLKSDLGTSQSAPMDPALGCVSGNDSYPDIAIGRFSANSAQEVTVQVNKAINYEKTPDLTGGWYANGLGIASTEGAGAGDDGESDNQHMDIIKRNKLMPFTYVDVKEIYGSGAASTVSSYVNSGLGVINYCGHGTDDAWVTTWFGNSDIAYLSNGNRLPVIFSVACVNGTFHKAADCFAEAWLRKDNGGAVAAIMSTINQPWQPPMRGQDYMNDLLTGGYDYTMNPGNGTSTDAGRTTFGSIVLNSLVLMYAESAGVDDLETIQTWTTFGDASLQVRTTQPQTVTISDTTVSSSAPFTTTVNSSQGPVVGALVSLQQNGQVFSAVTDATGQVTINHNLSSGAATLVVTGFNLTTIYENVTVGGGPAVLAAQFTATPTSGSAPLNVQFTDQSTGGPTTWTWDFGDGSTASQQNPSHQYTAIGTYTVTLTVSNSSATDTLTKTGLITVSDTPINYCAASGSSQIYEYIQNVAVGSFSNPSGPSGYTDYSGMTVNMSATAGNTITLTPGFPGAAYIEYWRVWIDLNKDGDFLDPGEMVFEGNDRAAVSGTITLPQGTATGTTRMRVAMQYYRYADSCGTFNDGEVEDYSVLIQ